jgi:hypothetical protein
VAASLPKGANPAEGQRRAATRPSYSEPRTAWKLVPSDVRGGAGRSSALWLTFISEGRAHVLFARLVPAGFTLPAPNAHESCLTRKHFDGRPQRFCDSALPAVFYLGTAGLDSGPVTAGVAPFNPDARNRLQIRDLRPSHWCGDESATLVSEAGGQGVQMRGFRPGFVRANSVTKRLHR